MASQKKLMTKGQTVTHFAEKFEITKKEAASILDEYAALAIAETKKKGAFVLPGIGKSVLVSGKLEKVGTLLPAKKSKFQPRPS